jgi:hypothetical protein
VDHKSSRSLGSTKEVSDHTASTQATVSSNIRSAGRRLDIYLLQGEEGRAYPVQHPIYFISEFLGPSKIRNPQVQKLLYAVLLTTHKLRHYFDDHKVIVVTGFPIGDILHNKEAIGRTAKWACELGAHDIEF